MTYNESPSDGAAQAEKPARQRIAKLMARVGLCSRRDAEAWIVDGRVSVNGIVLASPAVDVAADDRILVDGTPLPRAEKTRLFLFHKPRGLVTSDHDPEGRATVADFLREHWPDGPRVVTVGRLDINTEGLLLLTNDGGLARILELPKTGWMRRYRVRAKGTTDQGTLDRLREGLTLDGVDYAGIEATLDRAQGANVWLTIGLREGKNREVKRVLESIGLEVNRLIRLSFGPFQLADLPEGTVDEVRTRVLRDQLGPALAAAAGVAFEDEAAPAAEKPARRDRAAPPEKPAREKPSREKRGDASRDARAGGDRPRLRPRPPSREPREAAPPPVRERPAAGTRKHVSTLRTAEAEAARHGPRRRIERSDVTDRKDRAVRVERLVDTRPERPEARTQRPRAGDDARRREAPRQDAGRQNARGDDRRREKPRSDRPDANAGRRHASPAALAKRVRVAKSGGAEETGRGGHRETEPSRRGERTREGRPPRQHTGTALRPDRGERRGMRPDRGERRDARPERSREERAGPGEGRPAPRSGERAGKRPPQQHTARAPRPDRGERRETRPDRGERRDARPERPHADRASFGEGRPTPRGDRADKRAPRKPTTAKGGRATRDNRGDDTRKGGRANAGPREAPRAARGGPPAGARRGAPKKPGGDRRPPRGPVPRSKR